MAKGGTRGGGGSSRCSLSRVRVLVLLGVRQAGQLAAVRDGSVTVETLVKHVSNSILGITLMLSLLFWLAGLRSFVRDVLFVHD